MGQQVQIQTFSSVLGSFLSLKPTNYGGLVDGYFVSPELPKGLSLNPVTGEISGIPTETSSDIAKSLVEYRPSWEDPFENLVEYTIMGKSSQGAELTHQVVITIDIQEPVLNFIYTPLEYTLIEKVKMQPIAPFNNNGGRVDSYTVDKLIDGLTIDEKTGIITGTPLAQSSRTLTTITGKSPKTPGLQREISITIAITVIESKPELSIDKSEVVWIKDQTPGFDKLPIVTNNGGLITAMTISPDLPLGMSFNFNTLRFQGTPYKVITPTIYTIAAKNGAGTSTVNKNYCHIYRHCDYSTEYFICKNKLLFYNWRI